MKTICTVLLIVACCISQAQSMTDSVYALKEVEKVANSSQVVKKVIHGFRTANNLSDVLKENTGVYVRNYGSGQVASISIRGTSAAQNDVLWNGVKLNSPALGQADASLFSMGMFDQVDVRGISQSVNVGGEVNLQSQNYFDSTLSLYAIVTYGSFNTLRSILGMKFSSRKLYGATRLSYMSSDNDYTFINTYKAGNPKEKLSNAQVRLMNFMQQFGAKINENNSLHFNLWLSDAQRQVPPIISKSESREKQDDYSIRTMLTWNGKFRKVKTSFTSAFFNDVIRYENPDILVDDKSVMQAFRNNFSLTYDSLKKFAVLFDASYDYERAVVPSYQGARERHVGKMMIGARYTPIEGIMLQLNLREHVYDNSFSPLSPYMMFIFGKTWGHHFLGVHASAARNFRFPTLNDLYWSPGGNVDLRTEKSWDGEAGFRYTYRSNFSFRVVPFCKYITDWIQWLNNGAYWEPLNVRRVLSRGVEITSQAVYDDVSDFYLNARLSYSYTRTTNLDAISPFDQSKGKQLIYVPVHVASSSLRLEYKKFYIRAVNTFTDAVFLTTDNSQSLKGYYLLDLTVGKDFEVKDFRVGFAFGVNNVTGRDYQVVAQRPMPGRSFEGTLKFEFSR